MNSFQNFKQNYLVSFWSPTWAVIILGILSAYYFGIVKTHWAVTGEFTLWGGHLLRFFGIDISQMQYFTLMKMQGDIFTRVSGVMIIGMFIGCAIAALMGNKIKLRMPASKKRAMQALIGGIIAGFGARLGMGCNLASFFTGIPQFTMHAWVFTVFMILGVYLGTKLVLLPYFKTKVELKKSTDITKEKITKDKKETYFRFGIVLFVVLALIGMYLIFIANSPRFGMAFLFGGAFGFIIAKGQVCMTSAFRDLFVLGRSEMAKALIIAMAISTLAVFSYIQLGVSPKTMWVGPNVIIGGFLFGLGIVIAGGCECGWMYRAVEGQVHFWIVGIGNILGATLLAYIWDDFSVALATSWPKINLLESLGTYEGLFANFLLLGVLFLFVVIVEKRYFKRIKNGK